MIFLVLENLPDQEATSPGSMRSAPLIFLSLWLQLDPVLASRITTSGSPQKSLHLFLVYPRRFPCRITHGRIRQTSHYRDKRTCPNYCSPFCFHDGPPFRCER